MKFLSGSSTRPLVLAFFLTALPSFASQAAQVREKVVGIADAGGQIGCSLFASAAGFPMDSGAARQFRLPASLEGVTCRFGDVPDGRYAVSVAQDLNGNKKV